ncbi:hypothetical protein Rleg2_1126 [Rhizobium leguminosarum bv. trifolii WSM2304]|uniref:Transmembrane protein n=1 Tax=Rhizobium leguminosarum bv. trifolii (strain WSM2304) TaxID=395492 RepID=A0ABF7QKQ4_RHILW|nr:hypothetical protein [Rhizobium leguminosarum]ACI54420.1 hypothetical protein Rleg2_1126 [Rhizobium leguminosarum bv. trifolii WSM2304]
MFGQGRTIGQKALIYGVILFPALLLVVPSWLTSEERVAYFTEHQSLLIWLMIAVIAIYTGSLGIVLYWIRENARLLYGLLEIVFAMVLIEFTVVNLLLSGHGPKIEDGFQMLFRTAGASAQFFGGLYVLVRGLDNVGQGLRGTRFEKTWDYLSLKSVKKQD